jgi:hypothetical protein
MTRYVIFIVDTYKDLYDAILKVKEEKRGKAIFQEYKNNESTHFWKILWHFWYDPEEAVFRIEQKDCGDADAV